MKGRLGRDWSRFSVPPCKIPHRLPSRFVLKARGEDFRVSTGIALVKCILIRKVPVIQTVEW